MTVPQGADNWRKSSYSSQTADCVEVRLGAMVGVRDTKDREGGQLLITGSAWASLIEKIGRE